MLNLSHNQKEVGLGRWQQGRAMRTGKSREIMERFNSHSVRCCRLYTNLVKYSGGSRRASVSRYLVEHYGLDPDVQVHYIRASANYRMQKVMMIDMVHADYSTIKKRQQKNSLYQHRSKFSFFIQLLAYAPLARGWHEV